VGLGRVRRVDLMVVKPGTETCWCGKRIQTEEVFHVTLDCGKCVWLELECAISFTKQYDEKECIRAQELCSAAMGLFLW
jgi:hypothetical protein